MVIGILPFSIILHSACNSVDDVKGSQCSTMFTTKAVLSFIIKIIQCKIVIYLVVNYTFKYICKCW